MQPSVGTLDRAPRGVREREPRRAPDTLKVRPWYIPAPLLRAPLGVLSASEDVVARDCRNRTSPHLVDIERARSTVARGRSSIASALSRAEWGWKRPVTNLHDCLVVFGLISGRSTSSGAGTARGLRGADAPSSARFLRPREYLFNNRESDRRLPHLRIDQVRGVRLGNPTGSDPR